MAKVERHVADALARGASLACGGGRLTVPGVWSPDWMLLILPLMPFGTMMRCSTTIVSCTVPRMSPGSTTSPAFTRGSNVHFFLPQ